LYEYIVKIRMLITALIINYYEKRVMQLGSTRFVHIYVLSLHLFKLAFTNNKTRFVLQWFILKIIVPKCVSLRSRLIPRVGLQELKRVKLIFISNNYG